ncbi:hypothetical protein [Nocardioides sp. TF02-7]|uniref:hypothetical protein n=1 Tax=Nocardioides sp. TF02-7 TaxID=2917724 RepID=UPI001F06A4FD|nr:hypothetical protein [Nocardioides sp. TF02-7]UMG93711.1 hypothetical protein MF408_05915 [Nocardioides sp. TF02-7]
MYDGQFDGLDAVVLVIADATPLVALYGDRFGFTVVADEPGADDLGPLLGLSAPVSRVVHLARAEHVGGAVVLVESPGAPTPHPGAAPTHPAGALRARLLPARLRRDRAGARGGGVGVHLRRRALRPARHHDPGAGADARPAPQRAPPRLGAAPAARHPVGARRGRDGLVQRGRGRRRPDPRPPRRPGVRRRGARGPRVLPRHLRRPRDGDDARLRPGRRPRGLPLPRTGVPQRPPRVRPPGRRRRRGAGVGRRPPPGRPAPRWSSTTSTRCSPASATPGTARSAPTTRSGGGGQRVRAVRFDTAYDANLLLLDRGAQ